jgi:diguanylate cyclase (GGDEF)-like protein
MKTILLVDDSKTVIKALKSGINKNLKDINILTAYTYKEAVKLIIESEKIHLAILDLNLPDAKEGDIVNFALSRKIPSIVLTGLINNDLKNFILEKDILDYFNKQDIKSIDQLITVIDRALKNYDSNILIVEDSITTMSIVLKILNDINVNTTIAKDGKEALEILANSNVKYDLIITDYNMPNMDGMELTLKVREKFKKDTLGIIVVSISDQLDLSSKFLKFGANDYIKKPFTKTEFISRVNTNLEMLDLFQRTRDLANKDFLTGAYNRRFFFDSGGAIFTKANRANRELTVVMFDIDKFKSINDTYGHDIGDIAIKEMAKVLNENLRSSDLIARFGGEEFCVLLDNIDLENVKILFEKIRTAFEENIIKVEDIEFSYTVSIGVCFGMKNSLEDMIKIADEALYYCKKNGRNQVCVR